jgi:CRISPR-associated protein Cst2
MTRGIKNVTITIIFEGSALNRDEKIGGNILSIKKLNVNGEARSFIGKPAIRHYLFQTLFKKNPQRWSPAPVTERGSGDRKTIQFDLTQADVISHAELDTFGYMFTIEGERSLTRKAPLGITKAISLSQYEADLAFYANHELVERRRSEGWDTMPGIYNKEEHVSFYKLSFTIDTLLIGRDVWIVDSEPEAENSRLRIHVSSKDKDGDKKYLDGEPDGETCWKVSTGNGKVSWYAIQNGSKRCVVFEVFEKEKKGRVRDILEAIKDGLCAQSSGEANSIIPLFLIAGAVKVPSPIFHPFIDIRKRDGTMEVIGVRDALRNAWLEENKDQPIVYIQDCERLPIDPSLRDWVTRDGKDGWNEFLKKIGVAEDERST